MKLELIKKFASIDISGFPDFYSYQKPLEMGLWILWVSKDQLHIKRLTAEQIATIIRAIYEVRIDSKAIVNSFNRAGDKIYMHHENDGNYFEIMKSGKDHLNKQATGGHIEMIYFEPNNKYTSKRILSKTILNSLSGELNIVDPYCGTRTLDILTDIKNRQIRLLTKVENLKEIDKNKFLRDLKDFNSDNPKIEFRNYPHSDLHDRYIISSDFLTLLGHSIKDLGSKESFAIILNKNMNKNIFDALFENFNRRWKISSALP
jgi:hypothetical protein